MEWTPEAKIRFLMTLNWTVTTEQDPDEAYTILRVAELPSVIATGDDIDALERDFWESLRASLEAALQFHDALRVPKGVKLPWESGAMPTPVRNQVIQGTVPAYLPQAKQTGSPAFVNELAVA